MKKQTLIYTMLAVTGFLTSCSNVITEDAKAFLAEDFLLEQVTVEESKIDFSQYQVTDQLSLLFPYIQIPQGFEIIETPIVVENQQMLVSYKGKLVSYIGKTYKMRVGYKSFNTSFSYPDFVKSFEEKIDQQGGELISDSYVLDEALEINKPYLEKVQSDVSINYSEDEVKTYLINQNNKRPILIQVTGNSANAVVHVIEIANY